MSGENDTIELVDRDAIESRGRDGEQMPRGMIVMTCNPPTHSFRESTEEYRNETNRLKKYPDSDPAAHSMMPGQIAFAVDCDQENPKDKQHNAFNPGPILRGGYNGLLKKQAATSVAVGAIRTPHMHTASGVARSDPSFTVAINGVERLLNTSTDHALPPNQWVGFVPPKMMLTNNGTLISPIQQIDAKGQIVPPTKALPETIPIRLDGLAHDFASICFSCPWILHGLGNDESPADIPSHSGRKDAMNDEPHREFNSREEAWKVKMVAEQKSRDQAGRPYSVQRAMASVMCTNGKYSRENELIGARCLRAYHAMVVIMADRKVPPFEIPARIGQYILHLRAENVDAKPSSYAADSYLDRFAAFDEKTHKFPHLEQWMTDVLAPQFREEKGDQKARSVVSDRFDAISATAAHTEFFLTLTACHFRATVGQIRAKTLTKLTPSGMPGDFNIV